MTSWPKSAFGRLGLPLLVVVAATLSCATPRDGFEPAPQPQPSVERRSAPAAEDRQQSELAALSQESHLDLQELEARESIDIAGTGSFNSAHLLTVGQYSCEVSVRNNVVGPGPAQFRLQLLSDDEIFGPAITAVETQLSRQINFTLRSASASDVARVEVRLQPASVGQWSLNCNRLAQSTTSYAQPEVRRYMDINGDALATESWLYGAGSAVGSLVVSQRSMACKLQVNSNYDGDGSPAEFVLSAGDRELVNATAADFDAAFDATVEDWEAREFIDVHVNAGFSAYWELKCVPG